MSLLTSLSLAVVLTALWAGIICLWTYTLRRQDAAHLWLAVMSFGIVAMGTPAALLYESTSAEQAADLRLVMVAATFPFYLGLIRFSEIFLGQSMRTAERIALATIPCLVILSAIPGVIYTGEPIVRTVAGFDAFFIDTGSTTAAALIPLPYLGLSGFLAHRYARGFRLLPEGRRLILLGAAIFLAVMLNDIAIGLQLVNTPSLIAVGYTALVGGFIGVLSRRFVRSVASVEENAHLLTRTALERTDALRKKDLQLAHAEALTAVGTLAASLAHEINNPIAFVSANFNHLQDLRGEADSEVEFEEVLAETQEGVARIRAILDELLRLAKPARADEAVDLTAVVKSVLPIIRHEARDRAKIEIHLESVPAIRGDRRMLGQVVLNLVVNAIHATEAHEPGGTVIIATTADRSIVQLHVKDNAAGITDEVLPHIFEAFYTTKPSGEGTGLGLPVSQQLVEEHDGRICIETSPAGTTMRVEFPAAGSPKLTPVRELELGPEHSDPLG